MSVGKVVCFMLTRGSSVVLDKAVKHICDANGRKIKVAGYDAKLTVARDGKYIVGRMVRLRSEKTFQTTDSATFRTKRTRFKKNNPLSGTTFFAVRADNLNGVMLTHSQSLSLKTFCNWYRAFVDECRDKQAEGDGQVGVFSECGPLMRRQNVESLLEEWKRHNELVVTIVGPNSAAGDLVALDGISKGEVRTIKIDDQGSGLSFKDLLKKLKAARDAAMMLYPGAKVKLKGKNKFNVDDHYDFDGCLSDTLQTLDPEEEIAEEDLNRDDIENAKLVKCLTGLLEEHRGIFGG